MQRKLSAILAADVVGYSTLMERDEAGTFARFKTHREELFEPEIKTHHGRVFKLIGDGLLAEFGSVVDAVQCAVALQREMALRNAGSADGERIDIRIGVNLGDVIVEGRDRHGEGVNIAARLQQLAAPGGICVSQSVVDQLSNKLPVGFDFMGEQHFKNIAKPVSVYSVVLDAASNPRRKTAMGLRPRRWALPVAACVLGPVMLALAWQGSWAPWAVPATAERMVLSLPDKPSIAVLPFDNLGQEQQDYFADGLTEDLITDLSKLSGIFVIARNSSWTYKDRSVKVQQVAEELGVQYVLEGSIRRQGDQVRINAQLIDALGGHHLWAERYDGSVADVFGLQDTVIRQIVDALAVNLTNEEQVRVGQAETNIPEAYDAMLEGWQHYRLGGESDTLEAIAQFERAVTLDPAYARAHAALAAANWRIAESLWISALGEFQRRYDKVLDHLRDAMKRPTDLAHAVSAEILTQQGRFTEALAEISHALALSPNNAETHISKAKVLSAMGRAAEAEEAVRWAMRLDPQYPPDYLRTLAVALFHQEQYEEALETIERVVKRQPDVGKDYVTLASTLGHLGRSDGLEAAVNTYNELSAFTNSPLTVQEANWWWYGDIYSYDRTYRDRLVEGLRKAGVPEGAGTDVAYDDYTELIRRTAGESDVSGATKIDVKTAKSLHDRGVTFVDVRAASEFARGRIPRSVNLDLVVDLSKENLLRVVNPSDEVVFGCHGRFCPYSAYASAKALKWGFSRVYYFAGGFPAWQDAGYPVETEPTQ